MSTTAIAPATPARTTAVPAVTVRSLATLEPIRVFGNVALPALTAQDTGGELSILLYIAAPLAGPPPHRHRVEDETFITIDKGFEFLAGDAWHPVPPHTVVHIPAGARHTFRNASESPARTWVLTRPGTIERFLGALAEVSADAERDGTSPDMARVAAVYDAYGVEPAP